MRIVIALCIALFMWAVPATAQEAPKIQQRQLLVQPRGADHLPPFWESPPAWVLARQQIFYGQLSGALRDVNGTSPLAAALGLMLLSFGYGVFHAAGPGHGKAVISGWLLANNQQLKRGILISAMSSAIQAASAILIVSGVLTFVAIMGGVVRDAAKASSFWMEAASYALIMGLGLHLLWQTLRPRQKHAHHHHDHHDDCGCGHAHMPPSVELKAPVSFRHAVSLALAIGMRPCTGALLVLLFSYAAGLYWAGIAATFAMALGTFITIAIIATLTVVSRDVALRFAGTDNPWAARAGWAFRIMAGAFIVFLGASLLFGLLSGSGRFI
ncbi:MAG: nickel/cobalt transporter [Aestuariivirgaceae bacterium]|nr:nickel/cobalt transporter [Aestuariivirgaceae bacterium]